MGQIAENKRQPKIHSIIAQFMKWLRVENSMKLKTFDRHRCMYARQSKRVQKVKKFETKTTSLQKFRKNKFTQKVLGNSLHFSSNLRVRR